jgi:site-specific DNA-methyltransferase (adenine-specific)/site-specific DNA-methyltransferase (cytosine-N4-specific)
MRELGWLWTEEYMWQVKKQFPGKWPNRFRDSWKAVLALFTKSKKFHMYQDAVKVPMGIGLIAG